jgi:predicted HAD superfamily Cof-like phosphohydrolase
MTDVRYVIDGTYVAFGWDGMRDTNRVHSNNMSKLGPDWKPIYREDGKVLKPDGFEKLDPITLLTPMNVDLEMS